MEVILIITLGLGAVYTGYMVISAINPVHSVFYLVLTFIFTSIILIVLGVEFLPVLFIIVYVGAIAVLFLFIVMMLNIKLTELIDNSTRYVPIGFIIGVVFLLSLSSILGLYEQDLFFIADNFNSLSATYSQLFISTSIKSDIYLLGSVLYTENFILIILASFILLVAMIGAIIETIYHSSEIKRQDCFSQIATKYSETVKKIRK